MKHLVLESEEFEKSLRDFKNWLVVLGYSQTTVYVLPNAVRELLHWLELNGVREIVGIKADHLKQFWKYLELRPNYLNGERLSVRHLKKCEQAIKGYLKYLNMTSQIKLSLHVEISRIESYTGIVFLTQDEIIRLYDAIQIETELGLRDKAILAIYYSCALRRSEGVALNVKDINLDDSLLYVREGKGFKERMVPIADGALKDIKEYLYDSRPFLLKESNPNALFISSRGRRLSGQMMHLRVKKLAREASVNKNIGLHTLRHSIATHLLQNGMQLHKISKFLGHESLESTQIYTHLIYD